MTEMSEAWCGE